RRHGQHLGRRRGRAAHRRRRGGVDPDGRHRLRRYRRLRPAAADPDGAPDRPVRRRGPRQGEALAMKTLEREPRRCGDRERERSALRASPPWWVIARRDMSLSPPPCLYGEIFWAAT